MTESENDNRIREHLEKQLPALIAALQPFRERPGAQTFYDSEKQVHELLRSFGDAIVNDALTGILTNEEVKAAALADAEKKTSLSTIHGEKPRSNSAAEPSSRSMHPTVFQRATGSAGEAASEDKGDEEKPGRETFPS